LRITEHNSKKHVSIINSYNGRKNALEFNDWEDNIERHIKNVCHFIEKDISTYKKWLDDLLNHYEEIKERIGVENLRKDNKSFKEMILNTQRDLNNLMREYIWEF
jgi:thiamine kinase-like enzyme